MPRYCIVQGGTCTNVVILSDQLAAQTPGAVRSDTANIGDAWDGSVWTAYVEPLSAVRAARRRDIRDEALRRIADRMGDVVGDVDMLGLVRTIWLSVAVAARQPTADMQWLVDMTVAVQAAISAVNAAQSVAEVRAVVVAWP